MEMHIIVANTYKINRTPTLGSKLKFIETMKKVEQFCETSQLREITIHTEHTFINY